MPDTASPVDGGNVCHVAISTGQNRSHRESIRELLLVGGEARDELLISRVGRRS